MNLMRLAYASVSLVDAFSPEMLDIARVSSRRNAENGVTGALLFDGWTFFSVLEAEASALGALVDRISRDSRHAGMTRLDSERPDSRLFSRWHLRRVDRDAEGALPTPRDLLKLSKADRRMIALDAFDPGAETVWVDRDQGARRECDG